MNIIKWATSRKYRLFQKKIKDVTASLWELDFKISKARAMREESRQARDRAVEAAKVAPEDKKKEAEEQVKGYEAQMALIDGQINGNGEDKGLLEYMEGLADLRSMYKDYSSKI